jgi:hypothetical protein
MAGLNRTSPLKFNHPGLATTAAREGNKLAIQNDIGETDAHVIVIHVEGMTVNITCSDVHLERLQFMRNMLSPERAFGSYGGIGPSDARRRCQPSPRRHFSRRWTKSQSMQNAANSPK